VGVAFAVTLASVDAELTAGSASGREAQAIVRRTTAKKEAVMRSIMPVGTAL